MRTWTAAGPSTARTCTDTVAAKGDAVGATAPQNFPQFQLFAGAAGPSENAVAVTQAQVQALLPEAIAAWQAAGLDAADVRRLEGVQVQVGNLGTSILGLEAAGVITINQTAAGYNWFVNAAGGSSQAFGLAGPGGEGVAPAGSPAAGDVDLLTVLEHELGHVIGLSDNNQAGDLMDITLGLGVRRAPVRHGPDDDRKANEHCDAVGGRDYSGFDQRCGVPATIPAHRVGLQGDR